MLMSMTTLPISVVSFLICGLARISLPQRGDSFLGRLLKARECDRQAGPILVAELSCSMNLSTCLLWPSIIFSFTWIPVGMVLGGGVEGHRPKVRSGGRDPRARGGPHSGAPTPSRVADAGRTGREGQTDGAPWPSCAPIDRR